MSTKCQTQIIEQHKDVEANWREEKITLYQHCDGYPNNMLKLFWQAFRYGFDPYNVEWSKIPVKQSWQVRRAGYAASFLCYIDPRGFQPEESHELHGDIAYYYKIFVNNEEWEIEIYTINRSLALDKSLPDDDGLIIIYPRTRISDFVDDDGTIKKEILDKIHENK